jgi:hypothetical protein
MRFRYPPEHGGPLARRGLIMDVRGVITLTSIGMERLRATSHHTVGFPLAFVLLQT